MNNPNQNIIGLRLFGNGISPSSVKPSEIANLISSFEKLLLYNIKSKNPYISSQSGPILHFHEIKDASLGISLKEVNGFDNLIEIAFSSLILALSSGNLENVDKTSLKCLSSIQTIQRKYGARAELKWNETSLVEFDENLNFDIRKVATGTYNGETTIIGTLNNVGGGTANLHVIVEGKEIVIRTSKGIAKQLAPRLYEKIVLNGTATWSSETDEILNFKVDKIEEYTVGGSYKAILELRKLTNGYWDKFDSDDKINEALFRD